MFNLAEDIREFLFTRNYSTDLRNQEGERLKSTILHEAELILWNEARAIEYPDASL